MSACRSQKFFGGDNDGAQLLGLSKRVPGCPTVRAGSHELAFGEEPQVLADGGLGNAHVIHQVPHSMLPGRKMLQNRQPRGLRQRLEKMRVQLTRDAI